MQDPGAKPSDGRWRLFVDTGGTFTDCLAVDPGGHRHRAKVLSSSFLRATVAAVEGPRTLRLEASWTPEGSPAAEASRQLPKDFFAGWHCHLRGQRDGTSSQLRIVSSTQGGALLSLGADIPPAVGFGDRCEIQTGVEAPILAAHLVTGTAASRPLPPLDLRLATTRGTNALLERRGARTAFFVTAGFADLLVIGDQSRPDLFALEIRRPAPFYDRAVEVPERLNADGSVLRPLDPAALVELGVTARALVAEGFESAAVALLHSYRNPAHEEQVTEVLLKAGFTYVSGSAALAPLIKIVPRAGTAVVDAYLAPVVRRYLDRVAGTLTSTSDLKVMTSAGGLVRADTYTPKDSLLSGPAGGVVGSARAGRRAGFSRILAFDMGGTSTDVARIDGEPEIRFEHRVGDAQVVAPALAIETVAAGGGSICRLDGRALKVGPQSAGASPGPACYGAGGPLTLTDVNLLLGRLAGDRFEIPIDESAARRAFDLLLAEMAAAGLGADGSREFETGVLAGLLTIAEERMAEAIRTISVRRGYDPAEHALVGFGGAGGQHACSVATLLGVATVLIPPDAALLSAWGLEAARLERFAEAQILEPLQDVDLEAAMASLQNQAEEAVEGQGVARDEIVIRRRLARLRLAGQETSLDLEIPPEVAVESAKSLAEAFAARYQEVYGYPPAERPVELESLRVVAASPEASEAEMDDPSERVPATPTEHRRAWVGAWRMVPIYDRAALGPGSLLQGPALVVERHSTTVVEASWSLYVDGSETLILERVLERTLERTQGRASGDRSSDPSSRGSQ